MSPEIRDFLLEIHGWTQNGYPEKDNLFRQGVGLCSNFESYIWNKDYEHFRDLVTEMGNLIRSSKEALYGWPYPFDEHSWTYDTTGNLYTNPLRIAFIENQVKEINNVS